MNRIKTKEIILGIDPGTNHTGYGFIRAGAENLELISQGRLSPKSDWELPRRLAYIHQGLYEMAAAMRPHAVAVEDIFHGLNVRSALRLGHARGVALLVAAQLAAPVYEYAPTLVKNAVAGYGRAEKSQVAHMVRELLKFEGELPPDAADALAVAICHAGQSRMASLGLAPKKTRGSSWRNMSPEDLAALTGNREKT